MSWVFWAILAAAALHVVEEYYFPGGSLEALKGFQPNYASFITVPFAVVINGLFLLLCLAGALLSGIAPVFSLSVAATVGLNGLIHIGAAIKSKGYVPGVGTGVVFYLPLAACAFVLFHRAGNAAFRSALLAVLLAVLYQAVPICCLVLARRLKNNQS